jgi:hypothetical protein
MEGGGTGSGLCLMAGTVRAVRGFESSGFVITELFKSLKRIQPVSSSSL